MLQKNHHISAEMGSFDRNTMKKKEGDSVVLWPSIERGKQDQKNNKLDS